MDLAERVANECVEAIIDDLTDRAGLRQEWEEIDADIQREIRECWIESTVAYLRKAGVK